MVSTTNGIYLGGVSGNLWFFNGDYVKGPIFTASSANIVLPITSMLIHKFDYETEEYLYVATDNYPRLFRAPLSLAQLGSEWESVYQQGELVQASTRGNGQQGQNITALIQANPAIVQQLSQTIDAVI